MDKYRGVRISQDTWKYLNQLKIDKDFSSINTAIVYLINLKEKFHEKDNS
jgi:hypothetical protein